MAFWAGVSWVAVVMVRSPFGLCLSDVVDLLGALETDPDGLGVKASRCKLLAGQSVQVDFAARSGGKDFAQGGLEEAQFVDGEFGAAVGHGNFLWVVDGVRMNALFPEEAKSNLRVFRIFFLGTNDAPPCPHAVPVPWLRGGAGDPGLLPQTPRQRAPGLRTRQAWL